MPGTKVVQCGRKFQRDLISVPGGPLMSNTTVYELLGPFQVYSVPREQEYSSVQQSGGHRKCSSVVGIQLMLFLYYYSRVLAALYVGELG